MSVFLAGGLNVYVYRPNANFPVSSVVERIGMVWYADSTMPTTQEGNRKLYNLVSLKASFG